MKNKKVLILLLVFIWMVVIFNFSNKNTYESNSDSKKMTYSIFHNALIITNKLNITNVNTNVKALELTNKYNIVTRKIAHASVYLVLGIIIYKFLETLNKENMNIYIISALCCMIYAISDEIHQIFVIGRTSSIIDVFIDMLGCIIGLSTIYMLKVRSIEYEES